MKITKQTGLFIVLGVSLAINVYIIGTVGVYAYKFRTIGEGSTWIEERLDRGEKRFLSQLEGDDQVLAQKVINERKPLLRDAFIELLDARRAVIDTLKTDAPNPQELARHLTQSQNAVDQLNINFPSAPTRRDWSRQSRQVAAPAPPPQMTHTLCSKQRRRQRCVAQCLEFLGRRRVARRCAATGWADGC